jgi:hypothetical protein
MEREELGRKGAGQFIIQALLLILGCNTIQVLTLENERI